MTPKTDQWKGMLLAFGPGIIWAGAAIGVSHLVQSTRAGAEYGWSLIWVILLVHLFKYPAFEFAPRYAAATGESLLEGYRRLGGWVMWLFIALTFATMLTVMAVVTLVTAAMVSVVFPDFVFGGLSAMSSLSLVILLICSAMLAIGRYPLLDKAIKVVILLLSVSTIAALVIAFGANREIAPDFVAPALWTSGGIAFMVALMGWMPSPIDITVWHSLWTIERQRETNHHPTVREATMDFNIGYVVTMTLAMAFLGLGALVMFGSGAEIPTQGTKFGQTFVSMYAETLGAWSKPIVLTAAIATMFSTTLTVLDAYARVIERSTVIVFHTTVDTMHESKSEKKYYWGGLALVLIGTVAVLQVFFKSLTSMVDLATTLSFLTAAPLAILNHLVVTSKHMPADAQPPMWLRGLSLAGIVFLAAFGLLFVYTRFIAG